MLKATEALLDRIVAATRRGKQRLKGRVAAHLAGAEPFEVVTRPTALQREAFKLLGVRLERTR